MNVRNSTDVTVDCLAWINQQLRSRVEERRLREQHRPRGLARIRAYVSACAAGVIVTVSRIFDL